MEAEKEELQAPIQPYNYWFSNPGIQRRIHNIAFDKPYEVYNRTLYETFKENRVDMLTIVGPVDDRTCAWCDEYVGRNFRVGQFLPSLPHHVGCFIDGQVPIFTSEGWKPIQKIKEGTLVLTHQGRFRKVTENLQNRRYASDVVKIWYKFENSRYSDFITVTPEHPVLTDLGWLSAGEIQMGNQLQIMSLFDCLACSKPFFHGTPKHHRRSFCSRSCASSYARKENWLNLDYQKNISMKTSQYLHKAYHEGLKDPKKITEEAHKKTREMVKRGVHSFQNPDVRRKSIRALASRHFYSGLEKKMEELLKSLKIQYIHCFKVGKYFVDFCIPNAKILIECDGGHWHQNRERDEIRTKEILSILGSDWKLIRFNENEIDKEVLLVRLNHTGRYRFIPAPVSKIERWKLKKPRTRYNLSVQEDESFIAKGIVVHNCRHEFAPVTVKDEYGRRQLAPWLKST